MAAATWTREQTTPEQRNDPAYRRHRLDQLQQTVRHAKQHGRTVLLTVTRMDCDVRQLVAEHQLIVRRGPDSAPLKPERAGEIYLWVVDDSDACCDNPPCSAGSGLPGIGRLQRCSRCKQARYCSPVCQRAHWAEHSRSCCCKEEPAPK